MDETPKHPLDDDPELDGVEDSPSDDVEPPGPEQPGASPSGSGDGHDPEE